MDQNAPPGFQLQPAFTLRFTKPDFSYFEKAFKGTDGSPPPMSREACRDIHDKAYSRINNLNRPPILISAHADRSIELFDLASNVYVSQMTSLNMLFSSQADKEIKRIERLLVSEAGRMLLIKALTSGRAFEPASAVFLAQHMNELELVLITYLKRGGSITSLPAELVLTSTSHYIQSQVAKLSAAAVVSFLMQLADSNLIWSNIVQSAAMHRSDVCAEFLRREHEFKHSCNCFLELVKSLQLGDATQMDEIEGAF